MNNKKRTLDCYFASSTKKTEPIVTQPEDDIVENLTVKSFDTHISPALGANDKLAEPSSMDSTQTIDIKGCARSSETILKFIFLAFNKS
jgi:hypothetical protein